ncbi:hypothetical protein M426DRAFT_257464 [Hypoxylon sp. CI-4A]|nr:hypothetical protein M426DRAFT_257464 [Hypoxylon sp. CI-4A]
MKSIVLRIAMLAAAAASVSAQDDTDTTDTPTSTATACAAQNILDTCLQSTESYVSLCGSTDYMCLCDKYTAIMTCFNNCPNDSRAPSYQQQKDSYCMNASLYATTSGNQTISRSISSTSTTGITTTSEVSVKSADVSTDAVTPTATAPTQSGNNADERLNHVGGVLAGIAGIIAALL